jgi:hypothetical protein
MFSGAIADALKIIDVVEQDCFKRWVISNAVDTRSPVADVMCLSAKGG